MKTITIEECAAKASDNSVTIQGWDETERKLRVTWHVPGNDDETVDQTAEEFYRDCGGDPSDAVAWCEGDGYYPNIMIFDSVAERDEWINQR